MKKLDLQIEIDRLQKIVKSFEENTEFSLELSNGEESFNFKELSVTSIKIDMYNTNSSNR